MPQQEGVSGAHCSYIVLNPNTTHGAAHLPAGASMETTSMFVMPAVALYGVDMANPRMGQTVIVHGTGLIGLGVVAACANRGCTVVAVDLSPKRLEIAKKHFKLAGLQKNTGTDFPILKAFFATPRNDILFRVINLRFMFGIICLV